MGDADGPGVVGGDVIEDAGADAGGSTGPDDAGAVEVGSAGDVSDAEGEWLGECSALSDGEVETVGFAFVSVATSGADDECDSDSGRAMATAATPRVAAEPAATPARRHLRRRTSLAAFASRVSASGTSTLDSGGKSGSSGMSGLLQVEGELTAGLVQPAADGARRSVQQPGDFRDREVGVIVQKSRYPQPLGQPLHQVP